MATTLPKQNGIKLKKNNLKIRIHRKTQAKMLKRHRKKSKRHPRNPTNQARKSPKPTLRTNPKAQRILQLPNRKTKRAAQKKTGANKPLKNRNASKKRNLPTQNVRQR